MKRSIVEVIGFWILTSAVVLTILIRDLLVPVFGVLSADHECKQSPQNSKRDIYICQVELSPQVSSAVSNHKIVLMTSSTNYNVVSCLESGNGQVELLDDSRRDDGICKYTVSTTAEQPAKFEVEVMGGEDLELSID